MWTEEEDAILKVIYAEGDLAEFSKMTGKERSQITARAHHLHLKRKSTACNNPRPLNSYEGLPGNTNRIEQIDAELVTCQDSVRFAELVRERSALAKRAKAKVVIFEAEI